VAGQETHRKRRGASRARERATVFSAMPAAALPRDEADRMRALHALGILDTPPEAAFDDLVKLTARLLDVPTVVLNLVDERRQWAKAGVNHLPSAPREHSFCSHAILGDDVMVVPDARRDPRFADNPTVAGGLRFYWGAPLRADGHRVGTLCVAGDRPRTPGAEELETLGVLAAAVGAHLDLRRAERESGLAARALSRLAEVTSRLARVRDGQDVQVELCLAAVELAEAEGAVLWRLAPDRCLEAVASVGTSVSGLRLDAQRSGATRAALDRGERSFLGDRDGGDLVDDELARRLGARAAHLDPIVLGREPIGVLCTWWSEPRDAVPARTRDMLALLAAEAAVAFERSAAFAALAPTGAAHFK